ncbi:hypothetical protein EOD39_5455 [Acipenser ruthenus]|uniref:Uncharacterized protein n=1 Tax=Acipenser ruthenus TaxID=7906 RepID=A0A444UE30_ACIRT|nr:hypothetical protein EOD39_5455 [Acipenser ruthenus]
MLRKRLEPAYDRASQAAIKARKKQNMSYQSRVKSPAMQVADRVLVANKQEWACLPEVVIAQSGENMEAQNRLSTETC